MKVGRNNDRSWMNAITFAEAGEWETARTMMPLPTKSKWAEFFELTFMAAAFAEEGMHEEAQLLLGAKRHAHAPKRIKFFLDSVGLRNVKMAYGILHEEATC